MSVSKREVSRQVHLEKALVSLGFTSEDYRALRRASNTLRNWYEHECNGMIRRDEFGDVPYWCNTNTGKLLFPTPDREKGALKNIAKIVSGVAGMGFYVQTDPRGAALYIIRPGDVPDGEDVDSCYSRGICVY